MVLIERVFYIDAQGPPIALVALAKILYRTRREVICIVVSMMLKNIYFTGTRQRPADILVLLLHWRFIVLSSEQPPCREHTGLAIARRPQARSPPTLDELLAILRRDTAGDVSGIGHITVCFVIDPDSLVLPVVGVERVEVVEKVGPPAVADRLIFVFHGAFRAGVRSDKSC